MNSPCFEVELYYIQKEKHMRTINDDFYIANLIARFLSESITSEESEKLRIWREKDIKNENLFQKICNKDNQKKHFEQSITFSSKTGWEGVKNRISREKKKSMAIRLLKYAAIIILPLILIHISIIYFLSDSPAKHQEIASTVTSKILPGTSKAILTLDSGKKIQLGKNTGDSSVQTDIDSMQRHSSILNYQLAQNNKPGDKIISYNKIDVPQGGEYTVILSDGTKVHLNSMSCILFPVQFPSTGKREVELTGEAYFEVAKTGQPFIVKTKLSKVEVLGTIFNISAYPNETNQTTLIIGSVRVNNIAGQNRILQPSQQISISSEGQLMKTVTVDTSFYTSWVKGMIHFKDQRLEDIMKILSRWYDMKIVYTNEQLKDTRFGCNINRYDKIDPFINLLEKTEKVHCKIEGKIITFYN